MSNQGLPRMDPLDKRTAMIIFDPNFLEELTILEPDIVGAFVSIRERISLYARQAVLAREAHAAGRADALAYAVKLEQGNVILAKSVIDNLRSRKSIRGHLLTKAVEAITGSEPGRRMAAGAVQGPSLAAPNGKHAKNDEDRKPGVLGPIGGGG